MQATCKQITLAKVATGATGMHGFQQGWRCLAVKMASCDSPSAKLATYKLRPAR